MCVDHLQRDEAHKLKSYTLGQYQCHAFVGNSQYFTLSLAGQFRNEYMCAKVNKKEIFMVACDGHEDDPSLKWEWIPVKTTNQKQNGLLKNSKTNQCLMPDGENSSANLLVDNCDVNNQELVWQFDYQKE